MNMATLRRDGSKMGGLVKLAGVTLSGLVAFGGASFAQPVLDITVDAPDTYTPGSTVDVTITIARTDVTGADDADVTALGAEITLPSGWKVSRDADANCDVAVGDNQVVGTNSTIQVKGSNQTYVDPPANTTCVAIPTTGNVLEIFWIPESGGSGDPLPVNFPVEVNATLTVPGNSAGQQAIDGTVKYRVLEGGEVSETGGDTLEAAASGCALPGDVNGDNSVDPADSQAIFDFFLGRPGAINEDCGDFCTDSSIDPADAQGVFNAFLGRPSPCGK